MCLPFLAKGENEEPARPGEVKARSSIIRTGGDGLHSHAMTLSFDNDTSLARGAIEMPVRIRCEPMRLPAGLFSVGISALSGYREGGLIPTA